MLDIIEINIEQSNDLKYRFCIYEVNGDHVKSAIAICVSPPGITDLNILLSVTRNSIYYSSLSKSTFSYAIFTSVKLLSPYFGSTNGGTLLTTRGSGFEELYNDRLSDGALNILSTNEY